MWYEQVSLTKVVELPVDPDKFRHFVGRIYADVAGAYIGMNKIDFEQRPEKVHDDGPVKHATCSVSSVRKVSMDVQTYCRTKMCGSGSFFPSRLIKAGSFLYQAWYL